MDKRPILIVEDNSDDVVLIKRLFKQNSMMNDLDVVLDGSEALDYLIGRGPYEDRDVCIQPVLVLLDTRLPKLDGLEVLQKLRGKPETAALPVIMMTNDIEEMKAIRGYGLKVNAFLYKPFSFAEFVKAAGKAGLNWMLYGEPLPPEEED